MSKIAILSNLVSSAGSAKALQKGRNACGRANLRYSFKSADIYTKLHSNRCAGNGIAISIVAFYEQRWRGYGGESFR